MTDDHNHSPFSVTVPGVPPRKNERHRTVRIGKRCARTNGKRYLAFVAALEDACWSDERCPKCAIVRMCGCECERINDGLWRCTIRAFWPQESKKIGFGTCNADPDAPISCVLDALQAVGVIDSDMRIEQVTASKAYDKDNPRTEIVLERYR